MKKEYPDILKLEGEKWHNPDPATGKLGTRVPAEWLQTTEDSLKSLTLEMLEVLKAAGINPNELNNTQVRDAIQKMILSRVINYNDIQGRPVVKDSLGDDRNNPASQRVVNDVNRAANNAQTSANIANEKANVAHSIANTALSGVESLDFALNKAVSGYQKLPSGLIFQWTPTGALSPGSADFFYFPIAFPSTCLFAIATAVGSSGNNNAGNIVAGSASRTRVELYNWGPINAPCRIFAIGV